MNQLTTRMVVVKGVPLAGVFLPVTPCGVPTKGHKTRKNKRTDKMIVRRRSAK